MENISLLSNKEIHHKYNRPYLNDLTGQDADDYDLFLETKKREYILQMSYEQGNIIIITKDKE